MSAAGKERMLSLAELEQLARQSSSENWQRLLRGLTDHFLAHADSYAAQYGDAFSEIVLQLLDGVTVEAREELSNRVAPLNQIPDQIVKKLAQDEYSVAAPVLELSSALSDSDLINIAGLVMEEHLMAISRRKSLGSRLTEALVKSDNSEVIREMAGNPGAKFSESTYRTVAEKAKRDEVLQEKLVGRSDLSPTLAIQLNPFLSDELKSKLNANNETAESNIGLLDSLAELDADDGAEESAQEPDIANVKISVQRVLDGQADASEIATHLADQGRFPGVCIFIGGVAGLSEKTINTALLNLNGLPIAVTCKGLGLSRDAFEAISHMRCDRLRLPPNEIIRQVDRYMELSASDAKKTLAVLQAKHAKEISFNAA